MKKRDFNGIEQSIKEIRCTTTLQADDKILSDCVAQLGGDLQQPSMLKLIIRSKIFWMAAAAVIIAAVMIGGDILLPEPVEELQKGTAVQIRTETAPEQVADKPKIEQKSRTEVLAEDVKTNLNTELKQVMDMFSANDIGGLTAMLSDRNREIKLASAVYLMKIGDSQAADVLQKLSLESDDTELAGIFTYAASLINKRLEELQKTEIITADGQSLYLDGAFVPKGVLSGRIADAETGEPVKVINISLEGTHSGQTTTDANGFYYFDKIEEEGRYNIAIHSKDYIGIDDENLTKVSLRNDSNTVRHFALMPACRINIIVVNESNEPIEGAFVYEDRSMTFAESGRVNHLYGSADSTDANGRVTLGRFQDSTAIPRIFNATHPDYAPEQLVVILDNHKTIPSHKILLKKGLVIEGYAEYSDGIAADNVKIYAEQPLGRQQIYNLNSSYTDDNGLFTLSHISAGQYKIKAYMTDPENPQHTDTITCMTTQLPPEENFLNVKIPKKSPQNLVTISGKVISAGDIDRVRVTARSENGSYGQFRIPDDHLNSYNAEPNDLNSFIIYDLEPGTYTLEFSGLNIKDKIIENVKAPGSGLVVQLEQIAPLITALVLSEDTAEPFENFEYRLKLITKLKETGLISEGNWNKVSDSNGLISTRVPAPGIYQLQVLSEGFAPAWSEQIDTQTGKSSLIILSRGGTITGTVMNSQGEPLSGAKVIPLSTACDISEFAEAETFLYEKRAVETDYSGRFTLENLPAGTETLKVMCLSYSHSVTEAIEVKEGQVTSNVEIVLKTGGIVEGYVFDPDGRKQPNVTLYFRDTYYLNLLAKAITDSNGFYQVEGLNEQLCNVSRNISYLSAMGVISRTIVPQNGRVSRLDFGGEGSVTGKIIMNGHPLAGNLLVLTEPYGQNPDLSGLTFCCLTDARGRFKFNGVPAGVHSVYCCEPRDMAGCLKTATFEMGFEDMDLGTIPQQLCSIEVFVATDINEPNQTISSVYLSEDTDLRGKKTRNITEPADTHRPYVISDILPGSYTINVTRSDSVTFRWPIIVTDEIHKVTAQLPRATAAVSGLFTKGLKQAAILFSEDKKVLDYFKADENGAFRIKNLPAGRYFICADSEFPTEQTALMEFELTEGEEKIIDIDTTAGPLLPTATLRTMVIDENGVPINGANIWLEGKSEIIEPLRNICDGQFFITRPGVYSLHAVYNGYKQTTKNIKLETTGKLDLDINKPALFIRLERITPKTD